MSNLKTLLLGISTFLTIESFNAQFMGVNDTVKVNLVPVMNYNTDKDDYGVVMNGDESALYFTSKGRDVNARLDLEKIYNSTKENNSNWSIPFPFFTKKTLENINISISYISQDGKHVLLYKDAKNGQGDLFESYYIGSEWSEPVPLIAANSNYHESSAILSPDEKILYFISNRPGGLGGKDIWICKKMEGNTWSQPVNAGSTINSAEDEEGLFFHVNTSMLYFASKGFNSLGGFDIYVSKVQGVSFGNAINLGAPINSLNDDLFFFISANEDYGYLSKRTTNGDFDIVQLEISKTEKKTVKKKVVKVASVRGIVQDETTKKGIRASIQIAEIGSEYITASVETKDDESGQFQLNIKTGLVYEIFIEAPGYMYYTDTIRLTDSTAIYELKNKFQLKRLTKGTEIELKNIFYEYNSFTLKPQSEIELNKVVELLNKNPQLKIEIRSHTDTRGPELANMTMSERRAKYVVDYLVSKGVDSSRLIGKGFGETKPLVSDSEIAKMKSAVDKDAGHGKNRRTEFVVI